MKSLGISLYPSHSDLHEDLAYISLAASYGCKRIFTCLLSMHGSKEEMEETFRQRIDHAHTYGMEVILDISPAVFASLGISYDDLSFFEKLHADGIRLDEGFDGLKEAQMTYNSQHIKIELNSSLNNAYIDNIMRHHPNTDQLLCCHNFYPLRYSGLSYEHFRECSKNIRKYHLHSAAFVSSQQPDAFGPWPLSDGLCTLEMHRDLDIDIAARHLFYSQLVDDVIIANCYASEKELFILSQIDPAILSFRLQEHKLLHPNEKRILHERHYVRGDKSAYMVRSTQTRIQYRDASIPPRHTCDMKRGDVVIVNEKSMRYKGELHIALQEMKNDGTNNVIGHIDEKEWMLLEYLDSWKTFQFLQD